MYTDPLDSVALVCHGFDDWVVCVGIVQGTGTHRGPILFGFGRHGGDETALGLTEAARTAASIVLSGSGAIVSTLRGLTAEG